MTPVQGSVRHPYPPSVNDLARKQVIFETLAAAYPKLDEEQVCQGGGKRLEESSDHPLAPAMGILNGLRLSVLLWGVILLGVVLIW
jgi:hypothetical protein